MKKINLVSFEPLYFVTLGFLLCLVGIFLNKSHEIHDTSLALISGGMGAYINTSVDSSKITPVDAMDYIDYLGNKGNKNNDDSVLIANKDYTENH
jgi:hypothetical protein